MTKSDFEYLLACPPDPVEFIERHAGSTPDALAMRHPSGNYSYQALLARIDLIAGKFHGAGLRQGDTAAIQMDDYFTALMSALALSRLGCTCIFKLVEGQTSGVEVKAFIGHGGPALPGILQIEFDGAWLAGDPNAVAAVDFKKGFLSVDSVAIFTWSSGSTGQPKMIPSTWGRLHKTVIDSLLHPHHKPWLGPCLVSLGFSSLWGYRQMLTILWTGGTLIFGNIHISTASNFRMLGVRHIVASIAQLTTWVKIARENPNFFSTIEAVTTGGARLPARLAEAVRRDICREIYINYGSTETGLIAAGSADISGEQPDCVGVVLDTAVVEIVDADGHVLPNGQPGSVRVCTQAMAGNSGTGEAKKWFFTGDGGTLREDGTLCILGRNDGVMNLNGMKFRIEDDEQILSECPGVADVALFTLRDEFGLPRIHCALVQDKGFDEDMFSEYLNRLPIKVTPHAVEAIPRGGNGKILRHVLESTFSSIKEQSKS